MLTVGKHCFEAVSVITDYGHTLVAAATDYRQALVVVTTDYNQAEAATAD